jgi:hypothetical protein
VESSRAQASQRLEGSIYYGAYHVQNPPYYYERGRGRTNQRRDEERIPVFRVEDTTGEPLEEDNFKLEIPANLAQVAEGLGLEIKAKRFTGNEYGYFSASRKEIALMSPELWLTC